MNSPLILVTGATGKTGRAVVHQLIERGARVRAIVRSKDDRAVELERGGAELVVADAFDPGAVDAAMQDVRRIYFCPPWHPHMLDSAAILAIAARNHRIEAVVGLSQWLASPAHPSLATRQHWIVDRLFSMLPNAAHVVVAPGFFADNYLVLIGFAAQLGLFPMPMGRGRNAPPSNEDIARVAVAALLEPDRHDGRTYRPTGPTLLSSGDMARTLGEVLGRSVHHFEMPMWMFLKALRVMGPRFGIDAFQQTGLRHYIEEHKLGSFEHGAPTEHVKVTTGREPEDFATIARRYAGRPEAKRSVGNLGKAVVDFMRIGLTPALDLKQVERQQLQPILPHTVLAARSQTWMDEGRIRAAGIKPESSQRVVNQSREGQLPALPS